MPPITIDLTKIQELNQLLYFIVKNQATLCLKATQLETLLHLALCTKDGITDPNVYILTLISHTSGKNEKEIMRSIRELAHLRYILIKEIGGDPISYSRLPYPDNTIKQYSLAPILARIAYMESGGIW